MKYCYCYRLKFKANDDKGLFKNRFNIALGCFSSEEKALEAAKRFYKQKGFCDFALSDFKTERRRAYVEKIESGMRLTELVNELSDGISPLREKYFGLFATEDEAKAVEARYKSKPPYSTYDSDFIYSDIIIDYTVTGYEDGFIYLK